MLCFTTRKLHRTHHISPPPTRRSEVVGRPLAALLANDGARVFSVDIDSIQEYTKRPRQAGVPESTQRKYHPRHVVHPVAQSLQEALALSDVVVSAVPSKEYKVKTVWLKDGCVCLNVAADRNFEADVREKVRFRGAVGDVVLTCWRPVLCVWEWNGTGIPVFAYDWQGDDYDAASEPVSTTASLGLGMHADD